MVGPSPSWRRQLFMVKKILLAHAAPRSSFLISLALYSFFFSSSSRHGQRSKIGAGTLTTQPPPPWHTMFSSNRWGYDRTIASVPTHGKWEINLGKQASKVVGTSKCAAVRKQTDAGSGRRVGSSGRCPTKRLVKWTGRADKIRRHSRLWSHYRAHNHLFLTFNFSNKSVTCLMSAQTATALNLLADGAMSIQGDWFVYVVDTGNGPWPCVTNTLKRWSYQTPAATTANEFRGKTPCVIQGI